MFQSLINLFSPKPAKASAQTTQVASPYHTPARTVQFASPLPMDTAMANMGIARDEHMVKKLTDDHRVLLSMYGQVMRDADALQWLQVQKRIVEFQSVLTDHLLLETVKVYSFLKQRYKSDEDTLASIHDFSSEMNGIRKHVVVTLASFSDISVNVAKQLEFSEVWRSIGLALGSRIQREEKSLYPLY